MTEKLVKSDAEWRAELDPKAYEVLRNAGTERAWSGVYVDEKRDGVYRCRGCGADLFRSDTKFESGSGWPSFWEPVSPEAVETRTDRSHGMTRTEAICARCEGHLGHVFEDGPRETTGLRFCVNSCSLDLAPDAEDPA
jgi:peptide-methionine (R)-S-oxide reductase